jgi:biopolymer transport protein ExbD
MPSRGFGSGAAWGGSAVPTLAGLDGYYVDRVDTSPFIAVLLVLLVIFMVLTPSLTGEWVPARARTSLPMPKGRVYVAVSRLGELWTAGQGRPLRKAPLARVLHQALAGSRDPETVYLRAENFAPYAAVLDALDAARQAGARRVGLIVEVPRGPQQAR